MKKKSVFILLTVFLIAIALTAVAGADSHEPTPSDVNWWWGDPAGSSTILRKDSGITATIHTSLSNSQGSYNGYAMTLWLVVFNEPGNCATSPCGEPDLFVQAVKPDVLYGGGHVIGGSENVNFGARLNAGDNSASIADLFGMPTDDGEPYGLIDPHKAEVHYVLRSHGPNQSRLVNDMIQTYGGGCIYDAPYGYLPPMNAGELVFGTGDCQDFQFAIHQVMP